MIVNFKETWGNYLSNGYVSNGHDLVWDWGHQVLSKKGWI